MTFIDKSLLYVYWLRASMLSDAVVYVGCSWNPEKRRLAAQKRYHMKLTMTHSKPYKNFDAARKGQPSPSRICMPASRGTGNTSSFADLAGAIRGV